MAHTNLFVDVAIIATERKFSSFFIFIPVFNSINWTLAWFIKWLLSVSAASFFVCLSGIWIHYWKFSSKKLKIFVLFSYYNIMIMYLELVYNISVYIMECEHSSLLQTVCHVRFLSMRWVICKNYAKNLQKLGRGRSSSVLRCSD